MQKDEFRHSKHWEADARNLGLSYEMLQAGQTLPLVQRLIDKTATDDLVVFFAGALASTEFIAEALGEAGHGAGLYAPVRQATGDLDGGPHVPHYGEPSHEDIVMDFARAYDDSGSPQRIEDLVIQGASRPLQLI